MRRVRWFSQGLALVSLAACAPAPEPEPAPAIAATPEAWCRVCEVDRGERLPEYLPSRLDVTRDGQFYRFCADHCRAKFDAAPQRYTLPAEPAKEGSGAIDAAGGGG